MLGSTIGQVLMVVITKGVLGTKSEYYAREGSAEPSVHSELLKVGSVAGT